MHGQTQQQTLTARSGRQYQIISWSGTDQWYAEVRTVNAFLIMTYGSPISREMVITAAYQAAMEFDRRLEGSGLP